MYHYNAKLYCQNIAHVMAKTQHDIPAIPSLGSILIYRTC